jgi:hypothetical protein
VLPTVDISPSGIQLNSGDSIQAKLTYDGTTLTLNLLDLVTNDTFTMSQAINIPQVVGGNTAYVGFTGGTGGLSASQKILAWTYTTQSVTSNSSFALTGGSVPAILAGASASSTITITPSGGFTGSVSVSCAVTGSPAGAVNPPTCSVSQPAAISGTQAVTSKLTINTTASSTAELHAPLHPFSKLGEGTLAAILFLWLPFRRRKWQTMFGLLVLTTIIAITGCGTNKPIGKTGGTSGTTAGAYTITVTGTSGSVQATTTVSVTVQ